MGLVEIYRLSNLYCDVLNKILRICYICNLAKVKLICGL